MPANPTLVIERDDGTVRDELDCVIAADQRNLVERWQATATVDRAAWLAVFPNINQITDRFRIERGSGTTFFEGRFRSDERDGNNVIVTVDSYERDAMDAEPTGARVVYTNVPDSDIVTDAINGVGTLTGGTVQTGDSAVSFTFAHASRAKQIRDAAEPAGQDIRYKPDRTVDFLDRLGSDKPGITISSTNQNYVDSLTVEDNSRDPVTHVRGLGAQHGADQVSAEAVISSYSAGDRQVWRKYTNKEIVNTDRLQSIVDRLAAEFDAERRRIVAETTLVDVDVNLGDRVTVDLPEHDIDRLLRCTRRAERIGSDPGIDVTLTNRDPSRGGDRKRRDDLERFNAGDQGVLDRDTDSYGWQPVSSSVNATRPYPYPSDVVAENVAEVVVNSIPYRSFVGASGHTHPLTANTVAESGTSLNGSGGTADVWQDTATLDGVSISTDGTEFVTSFTSFVDERSTSGDVNTIGDIQYRLRNDSTGDVYPASSYVRHDPVYDGADTGRSTPVHFMIRAPGNPNGSTYTLEFKPDASFSSTDLLVAQHLAWYVIAETTQSTAALEPGINDYPSETASNCDLIVNGNTVATNIGSGTFNTTVDISGQFSAGDNTIELTSDTLGLANLSVETQLFRRGRTSP